ncbi:MAG: hypothetical protein LDLANPLL_00044 [Turneriella sp.]|nr:hypothetical protein [Turneriella sp.]
MFTSSIMRIVFLFLSVFFISLSCRNFGHFWEDKKDTQGVISPPDTIPPSTPSAPSATTGGSTQINLTWTASTDNASMPSAILYEICQSTISGTCATFTVAFTTSAGATNFSATGLLSSTTYYYRIRAKDAAGNASMETTEFTATTSAAGVVNTPVFSPVAGTYSSAQAVAISSSTLGSTLCYTNDGSTPVCTLPTCSTGTLYTLPVSVSTTTTLKAIACKLGDSDSTLASGVFTIDTAPPTVVNVTSSTANGTWGMGQTISIQVTFSENVNVTGAPQLLLATGSPAVTPVNYTSGTGTNTLTFNYTTVSGNSSPDLDYTSTTALQLAGGNIQDAAGNNANLTLAAPGAATSLGANKNIAIDAVQAVVTGVTASNADGSYIAGQTINIQVNFSKSLTVSGTPQLLLATGTPATTPVNYGSGTGTSTLLFNYTVAAGNTAVDLDYANSTALSLAGGSINDTAGNPAVLTLPTPAALNSLGVNKNIVVDTGGLVLGAGISFTAITPTGLTVNWGAATDDITPQPSLMYKLVKDNSAPANINTVPLADAKAGADLLMNWTANTVNFMVSGLTAATTYHFAVLVKDAAGNMALYTPASQATSALPAYRLILIGSSSKIPQKYEYSTGTFIAMTALPYNAGSAGFNFKVNSGVYNGLQVMFYGGSSKHLETYDFISGTFTPRTDITWTIASNSLGIPLGSDRWLILRGSTLTDTLLFDPATGSISASTSLPAGKGTDFGANWIPITSGPQAGKILVVNGQNAKNTTLIDPSGPSYTNPFTLSTNVYYGGTACTIPTGANAGKTVYIHGGATGTGSINTSVFDPVAFTFNPGTSLPANAADGTLCFPIDSGPQAGNIMVLLGNSMASVILNTSTLTFTAGPSLPNTIFTGSHQFKLTAGPNIGKTFIILANATTNTAIFDPSVPSFSSGPPLPVAANYTCQSWDLP